MIGPNLLGYVANIPMRAFSDSEGETSSGEETGTFPESYFEHPHEHFRLAPPETHKRGRCGTMAIRGTPLKRQRSQNSTTPDKLARLAAQGRKLFKQLEEETFGRSAEESKEIAKQRLKVVVGMNKMLSVSKSRNYGLQSSVNQFSRESSTAKVFGFFWEGVFQEKLHARGKWKDVDSFQRVQEFYRQYKKRRGKEAAEVFRQELERTRGHQVPYRGIREKISTGLSTASSVRELRNNEITEIYLTILDADSISLRAQDGRGVLTHYDGLIQENSAKQYIPLEVGSCGYLFNGQTTESSKVDPIMEVATTIDMAIRQKTSESLPYGVYYPEPSMVIRIPPDAEHIPYSFEIPGERNYSSPHESVNILNQVQTKFNGSQDVVAFNANGAIITTTPERAERPFAAHYNNSGKIVRWSERDIMRMRGVSQSHFHSKKWAEHLLRNLAVPKTKRVRIDSGRIIIGSEEIKLMVISLISRLFSYYDPVKIAQRRLSELKQSKPEASFQIEFVHVLLDYKPHLYALKKGKIGRKRDDPQIQKIWRILDSNTSIERLKKHLKLFLSQDEVDRIDSAAQNSCRQVSRIFLERFEINFQSLSIALMEDYLFSLDSTSPGFGGTHDISQCILENQFLDVTEKLKSDFKQKLLTTDATTCRDLFRATPLHWAAITGNRKFIEKLQELIDILDSNIKAKEEQQMINPKKRQETALRIKVKKLKNIRRFLNLRATAIGGAMPFHCALKYCADNANDIKLLELLIDYVSADARTSDGVTPMVLALNELENPGPVVELICKHSDVYREYEDILVPLLNSLDPCECQESMLLTLLYHLPPTADAYRLIKRLIKDGLRNSKRGFVLETHNLINDLGISSGKLKYSSIESLEQLTGKKAKDPIFLANERMVSAGDRGNIELLVLMLGKDEDPSEPSRKTTAILRERTGRRDIMCQKDELHMLDKRIEERKVNWLSLFRDDFDWILGHASEDGDTSDDTVVDEFTAEVFEDFLDENDAEYYPNEFPTEYSSDDDEPSGSNDSTDESGSSSDYDFSSSSNASSSSDADSEFDATDEDY